MGIIGLNSMATIPKIIIQGVSSLLYSYAITEIAPIVINIRKKVKYPIGKFSNPKNRKAAQISRKVLI
jgi:hypothetical protein